MTGVKEMALSPIETGDETLGLVKKLAEVMQAVERVPKRGRNEFHKYDYATEADIVAVVRLELARRGVMLFPAIVGESRVPVGDKGSVLTALDMEFEFVDGVTGETIKKSWKGYGTDKEDKGGYKAMTGGEKYFLLKTFLMPTGDDPEADEKPSRRDRAATPTPVTPPGFDGWLADMEATASEGPAALKAAWTASPLHLRAYLTTTDPQRWERVKTKASQMVPA